MKTQDLEIATIDWEKYCNRTKTWVAREVMIATGIPAETAQEIRQMWTTRETRFRTTYGLTRRAKEIEGLPQGDPLVVEVAILVQTVLQEKIHEETEGINIGGTRKTTRTKVATIAMMDDLTIVQKKQGGNEQDDEDRNEMV